MADLKIRRALIAVYDKTGVADFAQALVKEFGVEIISTGGTAKHLKEHGIPVTLVETLTGFPEMLDGRVKTLHPKIFAAILADRDNPEHMRQLAEQGIEPIDMVVVNLYPFEQTVADPNCTFEQAIEMIDIGGPCLLRAAGKNHKHVAIVWRAEQYGLVLEHMRGFGGRAGREYKRRWAGEEFLIISLYDRQVSHYLTNPMQLKSALPNPMDLRLIQLAGTRYGENPHQIAGRFIIDEEMKTSHQLLEQYPDDLERTLSFNNLVDADAAWALCVELTRSASKLAGGNVWHRLIAGAASTKSEPTKSDHMAPIAGEQFTRRNLPHLQRAGATYFVTFRTRSGELSPSERDLVMECCLFPDGRKVCIHAVVVMPDHVHVLLTPLESEGGGCFSLGEILHGIKGVSARKVADSRGQRGPIWMDESFDLVIRNEKEFFEKLEYICENPVTAALPDATSYAWCVCERDPGWLMEDDAGGVDPNHELACYFGGAVAGERGWHRPLAGVTRMRSDAHRLLAGATQVPTQAAARSKPACAVFIKHTNACGVGSAAPTDENAEAYGDAQIEAYRRAYLGDPNAAMGGILAVNFPVDAAFAEVVMETMQRFKADAERAGCKPVPQAFFVEVIVAPSFDEEAVRIIRGTAQPAPERPNPPKKKWGERVRMLEVGDMLRPPDPNELDYKRIAGGMLVQTRDTVGLNEEQWKVVTKRAPTESEMSDLRLAWLIAKHTKSNAISICKDGMLIGNGAGQMSRVMSCRIATWLAKENGHADKLRGEPAPADNPWGVAAGTLVNGPAAASDAFFPFRDGPDILIDAGVTAIIQPGGSKRDEEVIAACNERGVAMVFTGTRHFKH